MPILRPGLLQQADLMGQEEGAVLTDLAHSLFPASTQPLSDRDVAGVRRCLIEWVRAIEIALLPDESVELDQKSPFPACWSPLSQSNLLSDQALLQEARLRHFLWQFGHNDAGEHADQPTAHIAQPYVAIGQLATMEDTMLADAAMKHASALLRDTYFTVGQLAELPVELLHLLAWRIVAAHEILSPGRQSTMQPRVADLLAHHDESRSLVRSAQHLAHKMMELHVVDTQNPPLSPAKYGMAVTVAMVSLASGLGFTAIGMMAMERGMPRLTLLLRAMGYEEHAVSGLLGWIVGRIGYENAALQSLNAFLSVSRDDAQAMVANWRVPSPSEDGA